MELDRRSGLFAVLFVGIALVAATGCGAGASLSPAASAQPTSAVTLMAAELREVDDAPRVGKSQRSDSSVLDDEDGKHESFSHGGLDRKHGGFSGYL